jgi:hypothetical protein
MALSTKQSTSEQQLVQKAAIPTTQLFKDERVSTSTQLKQQQLMRTTQGAPYSAWKRRSRCKVNSSRNN